MMSSPALLFVVLDSGSSGRLTLTLDACMRHTSVDGEVGTAVAARRPIEPQTQAAAERIRAGLFGAAGLAPAVNAAVAASAADLVALVPAGFVPMREFVPTARLAADRDAGADAWLPVIELTAPDGVERRIWGVDSPTFADLVADPSSVADVVVVRRQSFLDLGGLGVEGGAYAILDLLLALASRGRLRSLGGPLIEAESRTAMDWHRRTGDESLGFLRGVLEKFRPVIERQARDIFVERELALGRLVRRHRRLVDDRDRDAGALARLLAELDDGRRWLLDNGESLDWGDFRRTDPISRDWGYDRGVPIDRYYIDAFLAAHSSDVRGIVLEVQEDDLTRQFGGPRTTRRDVVDLNDANPRATVVADLRHAPHIPGDFYDAIVLTQTLHVIDDMPAVLRECLRILKPGGVLLATLPAASRVCLEYGAGGDLWRVTPAGAQHLLESTFGVGQVDVTPYGNVQTNLAFLHGLATIELTPEEFDQYDPYYPALSGVRARKKSAASGKVRCSRHRGVVLLYHRVDPTKDVHDLGVHPDRFVEQLRWLTSNCSVLPLEELLNASEDDLPERAVAVTFDDGYLDNLEVAAPLLEEAGLPATFFLTTGLLETPGHYWWDRLEQAILHADTPQELRIVIDGRPRTFDTGTAQARRVAHDAIHPLLVQSTLDQREALLDTIVRWSGGSAPPALRRPLRADEAIALSRRPGVTIGAHTVRHLALPAQSDEAVCREIETSRGELARVLGRPVTSFAYPYGAVDNRVSGIVRAIVPWGLTCGETAVGCSFDAARVPRVEIKDWTAEQIASRLTSVFEHRPELPSGLR